MQLEFLVYSSKFLEVFGVYLAFFGLLWTISYVFKSVR